MIKEALRSLKDDFLRTLFYWLIFVLTTFFMFLLFQLIYSLDVQLVANQGDNMPIMIAGLVIMICMIVIYFANDFYVKKKTEAIAIQLVCGATYLQICVFLMSQILLIFFSAITFGMLLGCLIFPLMQGLFQWVFHIHLSMHIEAFYGTMMIVAIELVWGVILNLGYAYRSSIMALLQDRKSSVNQSPVFMMTFRLNFQLKKGYIMKRFVAILLFICPIFMMYSHNDVSGMIIFSIIGLIGFYMCMKHVMNPLVDYVVKKCHYQNGVVLGLIRHDLKVMKNSILLFVISHILLISFLSSFIENQTMVILSFCSFVVVDVLLALSMMFRFSTELVTRKNIFLSLERDNMK